MAILRDENMLALNDLVVASREAANRITAASEAMDDDGLATRLAALAEQRTAAADELAEIIVSQDDIPNVPNSERELLRNVATRVVAALSDDRQRELLVRCRDADDAIVEAAERVLSLNVGNPADGLARSLHGQAATQIRQLLADFDAA